MNQRTRMIAVLSSLVVAMTGTAGLLAWMEPFSTPREPVPEPQLMEMARATVSDAVPIDPHLWRSISVFGAPHATEFLVAAAAPDYHFIVDANGRFGRARSWIAQQMFDAAPSTVRIQVTQASRANRVSPLQWASAQALVRALREKIPLGPDMIRLNLGPAPGEQEARAAFPAASAPHPRVAMLAQWAIDPSRREPDLRLHRSVA